MARKPADKSSRQSSRSSQSGARRRSRSNSKITRRDTPNVLTMLRDDHTAVAKLFQDYKRRGKRLSPDQKHNLAQRICMELKIHAHLEEELFYPTLREALGSDSGTDALNEAEVEHASVKDLIAQLEADDPDSMLYDAKIAVLGEYVQHHVREEESEIFRLARNAKLDLKRLGDELAERKRHFQAESMQAA